MDEFKEIIWSVEDQAEDNSIDELFELIVDEYDEQFTGEHKYNGAYGIVKVDDGIVLQYSHVWGEDESSQMRIEYKYTYGK